MIDTVCGKDCQWPVGAQFVIEHALREYQSRVASLGVADNTLPTVRLLHDKNAVRSLLCPEVQPGAYPGLVICQGIDRPHQPCIVRPMNQVDVGRKKAHWSQGRMMNVGCAVQCTQRLGSLMDGIYHRKGTLKFPASRS